MSMSTFASVSVGGFECLGVIAVSVCVCVYVCVSECVCVWVCQESVCVYICLYYKRKIEIVRQRKNNHQNQK